MESRKRFKADINEDYIERIFLKSKSKPFKKINAKLDSKFDDVKCNLESQDDSKPKFIHNLPNEMLPKSKLPTERLREIAKPDNWIQPERIKPDREKLLREEKNNITRKIDEQQDFSRAARTLKLAINKVKRPDVPRMPAEADDDDFLPKRNNNLTDDSGPIIRKNYSKVFLQNFFERADSIAAGKEVTRKRKRL